MADDITVQQKTADVQAAVQTYQKAAGDLESYLADAKTTLNNVNNQTDSAWIREYTAAFQDFFDKGVNSAVARIKTTAGQLGEIAQKQLEEDMK